MEHDLDLLGQITGPLETRLHKIQRKEIEFPFQHLNPKAIVEDIQERIFDFDIPNALFRLKTLSEKIDVLLQKLPGIVKGIEISDSSLTKVHMEENQHSGSIFSSRAHFRTREQLKAEVAIALESELNVYKEIIDQLYKQVIANSAHVHIGEYSPIPLSLNIGQLAILLKVLYTSNIIESKVSFAEVCRQMALVFTRKGEQPISAASLIALSTADNVKGIEFWERKIPELSEGLNDIITTKPNK